jgi:hypothetical protein
MARAHARVESDGTVNRLVVECRHGAARADVPAPIDPFDKSTNAMNTAILRHYRLFRCRCTQQLWRRWLSGYTHLTLAQVARTLDRSEQE